MLHYLFAAAASIIVVTGAALLWRSQRAVPTTQVASPIVTLSTTTGSAIAPPAPAAGIATLEIALVSTRGSDRAPNLILSPASRDVVLRIRLNSADRFPAYDVVIRTTDGSKVWSGPASVASPGRISVQIPSPLLKSGDYEITVAAMRENGSQEDLGYQTITVLNRASSP